MRGFKTLWVLGAALVLFSCAHHSDPQQERLYHLVADRPIICSKGADCDKKWARAIEWVRQHNAGYMSDGRRVQHSFQHLTKFVIQTPGGVPTAQFRILRIPREDGTFSIDYTCACDDGDECFRKYGRALKMSFVSAIIGVPEGVVFTPPDTFSFAEGYSAPQGNGQWVTDVAHMHIIRDKMKTALDACRQQRLAGELSGFEASAECSNPSIKQAFLDEHFPRTDLLDALLSKRLAAAREADEHTITEAQMNQRMQAEFDKMLEAANPVQQQ